MLNYILKEIRTVDVAVWWVAGVVSIALAIVVGWHAYQDFHTHASAPTAIHSS